jgi:FkbM family methyltransferase
MVGKWPFPSWECERTSLSAFSSCSFLQRAFVLTQIGTYGFISAVGPILSHVLRRLGTALNASHNFGNPIEIGWKRVFGKPSDLLTVVDRASGVRCLCTLNSQHMFSDIWYSHTYDVPGVPIRAEDVVIDIGANQGFFSCYAAFKGARVFAFEPVPELCQRLRENVARNGFADRVTIRQCAVGASSGFVNLFVSSRLGGAQSTIVPEFVRSADVPVVEEIQVECKTLSQILDEFSLQSVRLCKLDVEGAELAILKTLSHADLARIQSFALEYHQEAYDLRSLLSLVLGWQTYHVSFIEERPYTGSIMRLAAGSALMTS